MSVTFDVSKFDKSKDFNAAQLWNMRSMFVTLDVLNFVTSNSDSPAQLMNM